MTKELLWAHGLHSPPCVQEDHRRRGLQPHLAVEEMIKATVIHTQAAQEGNSVENQKTQENTAVLALLKACAQQKDLCGGSRIHAGILQSGLLAMDICVGTAVVNMYAKCGAIEKARKVFDELPVHDVVSWNAIIIGYAQHGLVHEALSCFERMQDEGLSPNPVTFICILKACGIAGADAKGEEIHAQVVRQGLLEKNVMLGTALMDMYAKCGVLAKAQEMFDELIIRDVVSWNVLITGYTQHGHGDEALHCFDRMLEEGPSPNAVTYICVLKACSSVGSADRGEEIHVEVAKQGLLAKDIILGTALVDMYAKCGSVAKAQEVFDALPTRNIVSWNALISGYSQLGYGDKALNCFERMQELGLFPNTVTFTCVLQACGSVGAAEKGEEIHASIVRQGLLEKDIVLGTALVDMYVKCGALAKAQEAFDELPVRDIVLWSALLAGYAQHEHGDEALNCFEQMQHEGHSPNAVTFICTLKACGINGSAEKGNEIHAEVVRQGLFENDVMLGTAVVDMYAKCGALAKAEEVFDELLVRSVVCWNALIAGYAQHGHGVEALKCFERMQEESLFPNAVTFTVLLNACSHSGLVDEGQMCFSIMDTGFGIVPTLDHHTCMVDLFGRAGHLDQAMGVIEKMQPPSSHPLLFTLLGACRKWGNVSLGRLAFEQVVQLVEKDPAAYICMSNIYAAACMRREVDLTLEE